MISRLFFFNDTATTEIYTLSLHDALPIFGNISDLEIEVDVLSSDAVSVTPGAAVLLEQWGGDAPLRGAVRLVEPSDRKSTRLNSSHANISYAVFCLKKHYLTTRPPLSQFV